MKKADTHLRKTVPIHAPMWIQFDVLVEPEDISLDDDLSITIFRIFREATTNIIRHSRATRVSVILKKSDVGIEMTEKDNGIGISEKQLSENESYGIMGMWERTEALGGTINISGIPGEGTTLVVKFPPDALSDI